MSCGGSNFHHRPLEYNLSSLCNGIPVKRGLSQQKKNGALIRAMEFLHVLKKINGALIWAMEFTCMSCFLDEMCTASTIN